MVHLLDLGPGPLSNILKLLSVQDICVCSQTCRALHQAAQDDTLWQAKASELYPAPTVRLEHYESFQELVCDDNSEQATLLLSLAGRSCCYKRNRTHYYFECLLLALEWHRAEQTFRLYFEARGEQDLRSPGESSLGFMVHRAPPPDRQLLQQRVQELLARQRQLQEDLAEAGAADALDAIVRAQHLLMRNATQLHQAELALRQQHELSFADLLTVVRPAGERLLVDQPWHKLGYLEFDSLHKIDSLLEELPDSYASKQQAEALGMDLIFCYANPIPVMPHGAVVDYNPAVVATVLPGTSLLSVFRRQATHSVPLRLLDQLESEAPEERRQRWEHLPAAVKERQPPWLV